VRWKNSLLLYLIPWVKKLEVAFNSCKEGNTVISIKDLMLIQTITILLLILFR